MDEVFGSADLSRVEDLGVAARREKELDDEADEAERRDSKV